MTNLSIFFLVHLPILGGVFLLFAKKQQLKRRISLIIYTLSFISALYLFGQHGFSFTQRIFSGHSLVLGLDPLSSLILVFANLLGFLVCLYSQEYMQGKKRYFSFFLWLVAFANLEIMAVDFTVFLASWAFSIVILYALLKVGSSYSARKAAVILGFSFICFTIGSCIYSRLSGSNNILEGAKIVMDNPRAWLAFVLMLIGGLAKTGSGPMHTWIPTASTSAPIPVTAILPAALDKLLGIYIISRICLDFFMLNNMMIALLLLIGSITIIFAVLMALIQHDGRALLAYHAISQTGYMILGIGTGNPIGIIGAIFHMFNNALYKNGLFLVCGAVKKAKKTFMLDKLGGLAHSMPVTFIAALVFSLSISGIPPFNGFFSKWMLYKGMIAGLTGSTSGLLRGVFLFALLTAMFGSALTLASFIKFMHTIFLGQDNSHDQNKAQETPWKMLAPILTLAGLCVFLGIFSRFFVRQYLGVLFTLPQDATFNWDTNFALVCAVLISAALAASFWRKSKSRVDHTFVGGEPEAAHFSYPATEFYKTIEKLPAVKGIYCFLKSEEFDLYNILTWVFRFINKKHRKNLAGVRIKNLTNI